MALIAGDALSNDDFFSCGNARNRGSSFDLTIGTIIDHHGKPVDGPFALKPGHMIQVVSAETFALPNTITGHVTYKTALTHSGIWALTVGIVDPGWNGPISTTLLNFSNKIFSINKRDPFLRVSFFKHDPVSNELITQCESYDDYLTKIKKRAMTIFPTTFLDRNKISRKAGKIALKKGRSSVLYWITITAGIFIIIQILAMYLPPYLPGTTRDQIKTLQERVTALENLNKQSVSSRQSGGNSISTSFSSQ